MASHTLRYNQCAYIGSSEVLRYASSYGKWMMVLAVVLGALFGVVGFLPLLAGIKNVRKVSATSTYGLLGLFLGCIFISAILLVVPLLVCSKVAHDVAFAMAIAELVVFVALVAVLGIMRARQK